MNPVVRLLLLIVFALAIGGWALHEYQKRTTESDARLDLARIERDYDERAPAARELTGADEYRDEMSGLFRWYFGALRDHDNRFPDQGNHDTGWKDILHKHETGVIKQPEFDALNTNHTAVDEVYKMLQAGRFDPIYSGSSMGQHFDIWRAERAEHDNQPMIRLDFVWWGPQRRVEFEKSETGTTKRVQVSAELTGITFSLTDAKDKLYGEVHGEEPAAKIADPDRYLDLFPANAVLGTYWVALFPHEAQTLKLEVDAVTRTAQGHELPAKFSWTIPLKDDWKLAEGQKWEGATEEIREEEPPPKAVAPHHGRKGK
jgi:hypothetical protein